MHELFRIANKKIHDAFIHVNPSTSWRYCFVHGTGNLVLQASLCFGCECHSRYGVKWLQGEHNFNLRYLAPLSCVNEPLSTSQGLYLQALPLPWYPFCYRDINQYGYFLWGTLVYTGRRKKKMLISDAIISFWNLYSKKTTTFFFPPPLEWLNYTVKKRECKSSVKL